MNAAARKAAAAGGGGMGRAPALVAAGAFLISYNFFAMLLRGGGAGAGAAAGARDPVVAMPAWMREARRRPFHVALTATDAAYSRWQCRTAGQMTRLIDLVRPCGELMRTSATFASSHAQPSQFLFLLTRARVG